MGAKAFDAAVKALRGTVALKKATKNKLDCTPTEWAANADHCKRWRDANRQRHNDKCKRWRDANRQKARAIYTKWRNLHLDQAKANSRKSATKWQIDNPEKRRLTMRKWLRDARKHNHDYKAKNLLRGRLYRAIKCGSKKGSAVRDLGCTIAELWIHLESKFQPGMTRDNIGTAWEIDHVFPLAKADIVGSRAEFLAACNWRNLQPLTPKQNNSKNNTVTPAARALFDSLVAEFSAAAHSAA
jgi:hypothetical protein